MDSQKLHIARTLNILVLGDLMIDEYITGTVHRISPEAPVPVLLEEKTYCRLGGAANVALNLRSLGVNTFLSCAVGNDTYGQIARQLLDDENIALIHPLTTDNRPTTVKTRVIGNKNHQLLRIDRENTTEWNPSLYEPLFADIEKLHTQHPLHAIIFEDYNKGFLCPHFIEKIIGWAKTKRIYVAVDPKRENFFAYRHVDLFKPNLKELADAFGISNPQILKYPEDYYALLIRLEEKLHHHLSVLTLSEKGMLIGTKGKYQHVAATRRDVADVSGAGDTVIATFTVALLCGYTTEESAQIANIAAGQVCMKAGVVPVILNELIKEMSLHTS